MSELHDGFAAWVADGMRDELSRDLALHASGCDGCMIQVAAFDSLESVDLGAALPPPLHAAPIRQVRGPLQLVRAAGVAIAVVVVLGTGAMAGSTLFGSRGQAPRSSPVAAAAEVSPGEGVLGGVPSFTPSLTASPSSEPSPSPSTATTATPAVAPATPRATPGGDPPIATARPATPTAVAVSPPPATPVPTAAPTSAPTPSPTASTPPPPTPTPTPSPSPSPTPTPAPTPSCDPVVPECVPPSSP